MATRTAPAVTGAGTRFVTTLHLIDASGDIITESMTTLAAPTAADIEAWAAAYQASSKASLWGVSTQTQWFGDSDASNADVGQRNSVKDGVNMLFKSATSLNSFNQRLVAPIDANMQGNQDIPLLSNGAFTTLIGAYQTLLTPHTLYSAQYTERRERSNNPRVVT